MRLIGAIFGVIWAAAAAAQTWHEPPRGSAERSALMNTFRPYAEGVLGVPIEFVVGRLRVSGDVAFAGLSAQRPGGRGIDIRTTPHFQLGHYDPQGGDPFAFEVLFQRRGGYWAVIDWGHASQDVWWSDPQLCAVWRAVTPEVCY